MCHTVPHPHSPAGRTFDWSSHDVPHPNSPAGRTATPPAAPHGNNHHHEKPQSQKFQQDLLNELHPVFKHRVELILIDLRKLGWDPTIVFARRTEEQQRDAVRRRASPTMLSWHLQDTIGLLRVGHSHFQVVRGNAVDIVDKRYGWEGKAKSLDFQFLEGSWHCCS